MPAFWSLSSWTAPRPRPGRTPPQVSLVRVQRLRAAMGTWVTIEAAAPTEPLAVAGIEVAYRAIAEVEWRMHPRREGSDVAQINSASPQTRIPIADSTWCVLQLAQTVHALSDGAFDPCLPSHPGRLSDLALSATEVKPRSALCRVPLALDLGGIAINAGGDLRIYGRTERVLLRRADGTCEPLTLTHAALAVTDLDVDVRHRPAEHQGYYRRPGPASPRSRYAAVVAPSAGVADALTKCLLFAGARRAEDALRALEARRVG